MYQRLWLVLKDKEHYMLGVVSERMPHPFTRLIVRYGWLSIFGE